MERFLREGFESFRSKSFIQSIVSGDVTNVRRFIRQDQTIVNKMFEQGTSLHYGAGYGQIAVVRELLQFGAIQVSRSDGATPLMIAAQEGHNEIVQALLETDKSGLDVKEHSQGITALTLAVQEGHDSVVATLLGSGAKQLAKNNGFTPLMIAAEKGHNEIIGLLLSQSRAEIDVQHPVEGFTALHKAAIRGHIKSVEELIAAGAKLDVQNTDLLNTPLANACQEGHLAIVRLLIDNGANLNIYNDQGSYPIHHASNNNHSDIVKVLLDYGCDPDTVSTNLSNCK